MNRIGWLTLLVLFASGCSLLRGIVRPDRQVRPKTVGVALPLSGRLQQVGEAALEGIRLGFEGSGVELLVRDTRGDPEQAARVVDELAGEFKVIAILGGIGGEEAIAVARRADAVGAPLLTFTKAEEVTSQGGYVFRNMVSARELGAAIGRFATCDLGLKSFAVLAPATDYGRDLTNAFEGAVGEAGGKVTMEQTYPPEQKTFTKEAQKLTGRVDPESRPDFVAEKKELFEKESDPFRRRKALEKLQRSLPPVIDFEAVFLPDGWETVSLLAPAIAAEDLVTYACNEAEMERTRKALGRSKLVTATLLGWSGWSSPPGAGGTPKLLERAGRSLECAIYADGFFAGSSRAATQEFVRKLRASSKAATPSLLNAVGYDSARLFREVIERTAPVDSAGFRDALAKLVAFEGATGTLSFNSDRSVTRRLSFLQIQSSGLKELPGQGRCGH